LKNESNAFWRLAATALLAALLGACTAIPKQNLDSYVGSFNTAKSTAQDLYLAAQVHAEKSNDGSETGRTKLEQRTRAVNARLAALDVMDQYNRVLVKLATGTDPEGVKEDLEGLSSSLKLLKVEPLTTLLEGAAPFLGVISRGIELIDNAIKARKFAEAVAAAQEPMLEIIGILQLDARRLTEIHVQLLEKQRDPDHRKLRALLGKFMAAANAQLPHSDVAAAIAGFNAALARQDIEDKLGPVVHEPLDAKAIKAAKSKEKPAQDSTAETRALLQAMVNQANAMVDSYNQVGVQIRAHEKLMGEYRKTLDATGKQFVALNKAIVDGKRADTLAFAINVINLRKAYIEVREAK
jgi:hypothetical protein